jgi:MoxR-like ATPase
MATQNPIETEGTYPLPEAQVDRFMMKVLVDYPTEEEEFVIAQRVTGVMSTVSAVASMGQLAELQHECRQVYVDPSLMQYAVKLVSATRRPERYDLA